MKCRFRILFVFSISCVDYIKQIAMNWFNIHRLDSTDFTSQACAVEFLVVEIQSFLFTIDLKPGSMKIILSFK